MKHLLAILLGLSLAAGVSELAVRALGYSAWKFFPQSADQPPLHEPEPTLGWRNKVGSVRWMPRATKQKSIRMTFWEGGQRATAREPVKSERRLLALGGSFTQGWAVSDRFTYVWRLQRMFETVEVRNLGTAAYGTYQSLLAFEHFLEAGNPAPDVALYGLTDFHETRNVAAPSWLRALAREPDGIAVQVPYVSINAVGTLERHAPIGYPSWPLRNWSAAVTFAEERIYGLANGARRDNAPAVMKALLSELDRKVRAAGGVLLVAILWQAPMQEYLIWMKEHGIAAVDCTHPNFASMKVPGYGHPNAELHGYWADCLGEILAEPDYFGQN